MCSRLYDSENAYYDNLVQKERMFMRCFICSPSHTLVTRIAQENMLDLCPMLDMYYIESHYTHLKRNFKAEGFCLIK